MKATGILSWSKWHVAAGLGLELAILFPTPHHCRARPEVVPISQNSKEWHLRMFHPGLLNVQKSTTRKKSFVKKSYNTKPFPGFAPQKKRAGRGRGDGGFGITRAHPGSCSWEIMGFAGHWLLSTVISVEHTPCCVLLLNYSWYTGQNIAYH